jgi:restriction system protein
MPEITRRRTGELLRALFSILKQYPEGLPGRKALALLEQKVPPTEYEAGQYDSGRRYEKIVRWATVDAGKAGWMRKEKGLWYLTEDGIAAYSKFTDGEALYREAARLYTLWRQNHPKSADDEEEAGAEAETDSNSTSERKVTGTFEEAEEQAWEEIWRFLEKIPPYEFQDMVANLLVAMGYHIAWIAPPGKDKGVDVIAFNDPLGSKPPRIKVQVKRRADSIDVAEVRSFMAVLGTDDVGLFVTSGRFTRDAADEARNQSSRTITLIDRERFTELWIEYMDTLPEEARAMLPLRKIYFLAPPG